MVTVPFYSQPFDRRKELAFCAVYYAGEGGLDRDCVAKTDEIAVTLKSDIRIADGPIGAFDEKQMSRLLEALDWTLRRD